MNKKLVLFILLACLLPLSLSASWSFVYDSWDGHPRIAAGLVPTGIRAGVVNDALSLFADWETDFCLLGKVGYQERLVWQNPVSGSLLMANPLVYDQLLFDWTIGLNQYFGASQKHSLFFGYRGSYEKALDSMIVGNTLDSGTVQSLSSFFSGGNAVYGQLSGIGTNIGFAYHYNDLDDSYTTSDGYAASALLWFGPMLLNTNASYARLEGEVRAAKTLLTLTESGKNLYSIVLADRLNISGVFGSSIPLSVQQTTSLGSKVRGFGTFQFPTDYSVANQFDLRFNGPEPFVSGLFPRLVLFFDIGYGWGELYNTSIPESGLIASAGVSVTFAIRSYMDIGYEMAYLLAGENYEYPGARMVGKILARLSF
jgi:hypothetical protein